MATKYGIISDVHRDPRIVLPTIEVLKSRGAEKLILNGDIGNSPVFVGFVLDSAGKSGLETYVQPGSHEKLVDFEPVIKYFQNKYSNLINVIDNQKINCDGHELVFLPGSDFRCGGQYSLNNNGIESGIYKNERGLIRIINMKNIEKLLTNPEKTIVVCHVPRKFDNLKNCVDVAHFWQGRVYHRNPNNMQDYTFTELSVIDGRVPKEMVEKQNGAKTYSVGKFSEKEIKNDVIKLIKKEDVEKWQVFVEQYKNRGNEDLKNLYEEWGVKKAVSGHFHDSGHRANDKGGNHVNEGEFVEELFWNPGYCDAGQTGILTINDNKVKYSNINLQDYLK